jgi:SAM-dependent methyltransferase
MNDVERIYEMMRHSEMNDWVGGSDPEAVGDICYKILKRYIEINDNSKLLDFGCGIGRVALSVLKHTPHINRMTGLDIVPQLVNFCRENISAAFPQTHFQLVKGSNDHYDHFIAAAPTKSVYEDGALSTLSASFTGAYAFSVFTHVEIADFGPLLRSLFEYLKPGGELLFTAFLLTPLSRNAIDTKTALFAFGDCGYESNGRIFVGNKKDRLGFIAYDVSSIEQITYEAGLTITHIEHGAWTGAGFSSSLQDVIVCRRPLDKTGPTEYVPTVPRPARTDNK